MPHLVAVSRYECTRAKSMSPWRVRQQPPEVRCCTLTGRTARSAQLLSLFRYRNNTNKRHHVVTMYSSHGYASSHHVTRSSL
jgi:hypothetical protein